MTAATAIPGRATLWVAFFAVVIGAWIGLFAMAMTSAYATVPSGVWEALCIGASESRLPGLVAMWLVMSAAMMLPTFAPTLGTFLDMGRAGATRNDEAAVLVGGYATVWVAGALVGALGQSALAAADLTAPDGSSRSIWLTSVLLLGAGAYQFSAAKAACLAKCRMPLTFFMERWAPGRAHAYRMGLRLGAYCFGCCWALMALAFVGGTMNLLWMGAATLFMVLEKLPDVGRPLTRPAGAALIASSFAVAAFALNS